MIAERIEALREAATREPEAYLIWGGVTLVLAAPLVGLVIGVAIWGWPHG